MKLKKSLATLVLGVGLVGGIAGIVPMAHAAPSAPQAQAGHTAQPQVNQVDVTNNIMKTKHDTV
jgi:hypothetical protein